MAKDSEWEARWQEGQIEIERRRKEEEERKKQEEIVQAKETGNWCPHCERILPIETHDEKKTFHGGFGGGNTATYTEHIMTTHCDQCGYTKELKRWTDPGLLERLWDWFKDLF